VLESKEFVEELIYENIRLMEEIAKLELENNRLNIRAEVAERHVRSLYKSLLVGSCPDEDIDFHSKDSCDYKN
jgi:hypothetical protein